MSKTSTSVTMTLDEALDRVDRGEYGYDPDAAPGPSLGKDFWKDAKMIPPMDTKTAISLRVDPDILAWFKSQGPGYQTRMNKALREFMEITRHKPE